MQAPSWGIRSALQNPYEEAPALAPHMLSHPSHDEYTQLAEMTMHRGSGAWHGCRCAHSFFPLAHQVSDDKGRVKELEKTWWDIPVWTIEEE